MSLREKKIHYHIGTATILILTLLTLALIIHLNFPHKPIEFPHNPAPVITKVIESGDVLIYNFTYCKYMDLPVTVTRSLKNDVVMNFIPIIQ